MKQFFFNNPKRIFLFDAIGAALSVSLLSIFYYGFNDLFLLPNRDTKILISFGLCTLLYSSFMYGFVKLNLKTVLIILILLNLLYCCFSLWVLCANYFYLSSIGKIYFITELVIIFAVIFIERSVFCILNSST